MQISGVRAKAVRFEFSPLQEVLRALNVFAHPRHHAEQMMWVRSARRAATPALKREIRRMDFLLRRTPELFADLFPLPRAATFEDELAVLLASIDTFKAAMARRMLGKPLFDREEIVAATRGAALRRLARETSLREPNSAPFLEAFAGSPARVLRDFCALLEDFHERCLAAQWGNLHGRALEDAQARERLLKRFGVTSMLRTLTGELSAKGTTGKATIQFGGKESAGMEIDLGEHGAAVLTPSYFIWPRASFLVLRRKRIEVRIAYPIASPSTIRRSNAVYETVAKRFAALADPVRLQMLDLLSARDLSTRELAGLIALSEGGVSRHLSMLRDAGLVTSSRDGYFVLYRRSALAAEMLASPAAIQHDGDA